MNRKPILRNKPFLVNRNSGWSRYYIYLSLNRFGRAVSMAKDTGFVAIESMLRRFS